MNQCCPVLTPQAAEEIILEAAGHTNNF